MALKYPPQPCGLPYDKFRSGWSFREAYEALAYRKDAQGRTFAPSQGRIKGALSKLKRQEFERYQAECAAGEDDTSFPYGANVDPRAELFGVRKRCPAFTLAQARRAAKKLRGASRFPVRALRQGMNVEREHADIGSCHSPTMAARIALAHLKERPDYYARLRRYVER